MLLGALEAGSFPGMYYLVSSWYSRCSSQSSHNLPYTNKIQVDLYKRISIFYLIGVLGSAASGVLALGFSRMSGLANYAGWRWIFIMEAILTCLIGILGYVFMVSFPSQSHTVRWFLTPAESAYILRRLDRDRGDADISAEKFNWRAFFSAALDIKVWGFALAFL